MKRVFWDVLADANTYRVFQTLLSVDESLKLDEILKKGEPFGARWKPLELRFWEGDRGYKRVEKKKSVADFMGTDLAIDVVNPRARSFLDFLIASQVEFLPFETSVGPYYGLHVRYVDCLDTARIEAKYFSDGRVMRVVKYAFYWERLEGIHIFRLPELGLSRLFVSDEFRRVVEENGLTGLEFYPVPLVEE